MEMIVFLLVYENIQAQFVNLVTVVEYDCGNKYQIMSPIHSIYVQNMRMQQVQFQLQPIMKNQCTLLQPKYSCFMRTNRYKKNTVAKVLIGMPHTCTLIGSENISMTQSVVDVFFLLWQQRNSGKNQNSTKCADRYKKVVRYCCCNQWYVQLMCA